MLSALLITLGTAATPAICLSVPAHCQAQVSLEGFSGNDAALAVRQHLRCQHGAVTDQYTLIQLVDIAAQTSRATFAVGDIVRTDRHHRRIFAAPRLLAAANPAFLHARHDWAHWRARAHLYLRRHGFEDSLVRFAFAAGSEGTVDTRGKTAILVGAPHHALRAQIVVRMSNGEHISIGEVSAAPKSAVRLAVDVFYSERGRTVGVVAHAADDVQVLVVHLPQGGVVGTHELGAQNRMFDFSDKIGDDFASTHPEATGQWHTWVRSGI